MKTTVLVALIAAAAAAAAAAQSIQLGSPVTARQPGDYVIYHDTRTEADAYLGILYLSEPMYYLRRYDTASGQATEVVVALLPGAGPESTPVKVIEPGAGPETVRGLVLDLLSFAAQRGRVDEAAFPRDVRLQEPHVNGETYVLDHTYKFWVPIFQLFASFQENDPQRGLTLVAAGHCLKRDDPAFYAYRGPDSYEEGPHIHLQAQDAQPVTVDGLSLPLDANWHAYDGRLFQIHESTRQDAVLVVETLDLQQVGVPSIYALMKYTLLVKDPDVRLLGDRTRVYQRGQTPVLEFTVLDRHTHVLTRQFTRFIPRGGQVFSMETLAALDTVYQENRSYFDDILFHAEDDH